MVYTQYITNIQKHILHILRIFPGTYFSGVIWQLLAGMQDYSSTISARCNIIRCFSSHLGGPNACLCSGFALTVLPPFVCHHHPCRQILTSIQTSITAVMYSAPDLNYLLAYSASLPGMARLGLKLIRTSSLPQRRAVKVGQRFSD